MPDWSRDEIRQSVLAIYQAFEAQGGRQHYRTAFLLHYDLRLLPSDAGEAYRDEGRGPPRFLVYTIEVGAPDRGDSVALETHGSLEEARAACLACVGEAREVEWSAVSSTTALGFFNAVRQPGVAEFYDSFDDEL